MTSYSIRGALIQIHCDSCPYKKGEETQRYTGERHVMMGTEVGMVCVEAKMPATLKLRKRHHQASSWRFQRELGPADTSI